MTEAAFIDHVERVDGHDRLRAARYIDAAGRPTLHWLIEDFYKGRCIDRRIHTAPALTWRP